MIHGSFSSPSDCLYPRIRLVSYNGFLLTPKLDRLFDYGLISFDDDGKILISSEVTETEYESLGLRKTCGLERLKRGITLSGISQRERLS